MDPESAGSAGPPWQGRLVGQQQQAGTGSPYDYVKAGVGSAERAAALGLTPTRLNDSYVGNASFPRAAVTSQQLARRLESPGLGRPGPPSPWDRRASQDQGYGLHNSSLLAQGGRGSRLLQNPNKAWAVCGEGGQILVQNSALAALLGYSPKPGLVLWSLLERRIGNKKQVCLDQLDLDPESGDPVSHSGRVVRLLCHDGNTTTVSLQVHQLAGSSRFLVYLEPVQRSLGWLQLDSRAEVVTADPGAEAIFCTGPGELSGERLERLVPGLPLPAMPGPAGAVRLAVAGRAEAGWVPLSCLLTKLEDGSGYQLAVWVFSSLSGLLLLDSKGKVTRADPTFGRLVLGYTAPELAGRGIEELLPGFYDEFEVPSCDRTEDEDLGCENLSQHSPDTSEVSPLEEISLNVAGLSLQQQQLLPGSPARPARPSPADCSPFKPPPAPLLADSKQGEKENLTDSPVFHRPSSLSVRTPVKIPMDLLTSTPDPASGRKTGRRGSARLLPARSLDSSAAAPPSLPTGCFYGLARHRTGAEIAVLYQVKRVVLRDGTALHCVWVSRDEEEAGRQAAQLTLASQHSEEGEVVESSLPPPPQDSNADIQELTAGQYSEKWVTLQQIGKGAFGWVRAAYRASDQLLAVTKFIRTGKVGLDSWVEGGAGQRVPLEVHLLQQLSHPGIVRVLDCHQNTHYVQLVMEKHGDMDLFEFIDRNPLMDEGLASLLFRQVIDAVDYLHARQILHRDIKDENIIIDHHFTCKLIDFGSATFFQPGQLFSTFYGTVEYCSPDVLRGNSYEGPQLELWSLGVLLYIIMFGENPFYDTEDTMRAELHPPHNDCSPGCWELVEAALHPDPALRASLWYVKEHAWLHIPVSKADYRFQDVVPCTEAELRPKSRYRPVSELPGYPGQTSGCSGLVGSQEASMEKEYSNLCSTAELDRGEETEVEYSNLYTSADLEQEEGS